MRASRSNLATRSASHGRILSIEPSPLIAGGANHAAYAELRAWWARDQLRAPRPGDFVGVSEAQDQLRASRPGTLGITGMSGTQDQLQDQLRPAAPAASAAPAAPAGVSPIQLALVGLVAVGVGVGVGYAFGRTR